VKDAMTSLKLNTVANLVGTAIVALIYLVILPVYLKILGADAFGVVGIFFSLAAIFAVFDFGLGAALNRQMAQLSVSLDNRARQRVALRTFETMIWGMCALLGMILFFLLPGLVDHWLQIGALNKTEIKAAFRWMASTLALQMVLSLYTHVLSGLQRQVVFNVINTTMIALRLIGAAIVIVWTHADLVSFFVWQAIVTGLHAIGFAWSSWRLLPGKNPPVFDWNLLKQSKKFISEVAFATLLATLLMHIDKLVISKLITLKEYGYYMLAWSIASVLGRIANPVYTAWMPRLTQHVAMGSAEQLKRTYLQGLKSLAVLIIPCALFFILFSESLLHIYTGNATLASTVAIPLIFLTMGWACNGILLMPHAVAMAHGWTRLSLVQNALACIVVLPLVYVAVKTWGLDGAGLGWLLVNLSLLVVSVPMIHKRCMTIPMLK
jgi:O-antigen/teichoic acid export membrane protein